jgi:hypothetical protein
MLDAIISPEWEYRYFSFNASWPFLGRADGVDAQRFGRRVFPVVRGRGAIRKGFDHESPMSPWPGPQNAVWPGVLDRPRGVFFLFG